MKRGTCIVTPEIPASRIADLTNRVDEPTVLRESVRITSLSTERLTDIARMLTAGVRVRQAALVLVQAELMRRQGRSDPKQLVFEFD
jgi:hypothetical protein